MEQWRDKEFTCNVVFLGPASESARDTLIKGLQQRFRMTPQQAAALLQRAPVVVKKGISLEKAHTLVHHMEEIGAKARIERVSQKQETVTADQERYGERVSPGFREHPGDTYCFWEDMENLGFFRAFLGTIGETLFHPSRFYARMPVEGGLINPLIFALVMGVLGGLFGLLYQFLMMSFIGSIFQPEGFTGFSAPMMIGSAIGLPILTIIGVFVGSGILHVCLMIVRGNQKGFEATFRVIAYAMSTQVFGIVPLLGGMIGGIWALVIEIIGIRESHRISTGRAALAVLLPILVIVALVLVFVAMMIPIILRSFS